ncbi:MAG: hypothetical protein V2J02_11065, partial [Pseudomonadales bacterium]|nr:hypothetical protein [Pseudomonadales bacterium]
MILRSQRYRYSRWDGSQVDAFPDADTIMEQLADDLMQFGDLRSALRSLLQRGLDGDGGPMGGLRDLLRQLRQQRRERLDRFDLSSILDGIAEQLDEVLALERAGLDRLDPRTGDAPAGAPGAPEAGSPEAASGKRAASEGASADGGAPGKADDFASNLMGDIAGRNRAFLDGLPEDAPGRIQALQDYEFVEPEAQRRFEELLDELRQAVTKSFFKDVEKMIRELSDGDIQRMKDMVRDLDELLVQRIAGEEPDFDGFMEKYGDMFGENPPKSLDELIQQMQSQMAAMQSLMMSLPTSQFEQLQQLLSDRLGDAELDSELRRLMQKLDFLDPAGGQRYRFSGDESLDLNAAMDLMGQLQDLDSLEQQLRSVQDDGDLDQVDADKL